MRELTASSILAETSLRPILANVSLILPVASDLSNEVFGSHLVCLVKFVGGASRSVHGWELCVV